MDVTEDLTTPEEVEALIEEILSEDDAGLEVVEGEEWEQFQKLKGFWKDNPTANKLKKGDEHLPEFQEQLMMPREAVQEGVTILVARDYEPLYPRHGILYTGAMKMAQDEYDTWNNGRKMMGGKLGIQIFATRKDEDFEDEEAA